MRHTETGKNRTDGADGKTAVTLLRYMIAFTYLITATIKPFLLRLGHAADEVGRMRQA